MPDKNKTKEQLLKDLNAARKRIEKLEAAATRSGKPGKAKHRVTSDETQWRCLFESNPHPMWIYDKENLAILCVNNAAIAHYGYGRDEFLSMTIKDIRPYEDIPKFLEAVTRPMTGYEARRSWRHRKKDGTIIDVEITTHSIVFSGRNAELVMTYDVTERKRSAQQTSDALNFIRTIVENSTIGIVSIKATGAVVSANEALAGISGGTVDQLLKQNVRFVEAWKKYGLLSAFDEALATNSEKQIDTHYVSTFGRDVWISVRFVPYLYAGEPHVLSLFSDMSEWKRNETEKEQLHAQLMQAQKMEAIGQLAAGVAHDFNNILTAISGYGSILQMGMGDNDPLRINTDQILELTGRAAQLTQSLLAFSRKQVMNMKPVNLNGIIARTEQFLRRIIGEDIEIKTVLRDNAVVMADSGQLEQVLMNLAANARDAMPKGGQLIVETDILQTADAFVSAYGLGAPGTYAVISVADTGIGMTDEARQKIFEPFFTTKEAGRGTGLGLAIVYGIIKQHKGYINVQSEVGKGTSFKLYLPLHRGQPEHPEVLIPEESDLSGTETILLAEDDEILRVFLRNILTEYGYRVIIAEDGEDAIGKFMEWKDEIHICLFDMIMPKKSGMEVYEIVQKIRPGMKVIFSSGYTGDKVQRDDLPRGSEFIEKPAAPQVFLKKIREAIKGYD